MTISSPQPSNFFEKTSNVQTILFLHMVIQNTNNTFGARTFQTFDIFCKNFFPLYSLANHYARLRGGNNCQQSSPECKQSSLKTKIWQTRRLLQHFESSSMDNSYGKPAPMNRELSQNYFVPRCSNAVGSSRKSDSLNSR
jgi:hypothetical protein